MWSDAPFLLSHLSRAPPTTAHNLRRALGYASYASAARHGDLVARAGVPVHDTTAPHLMATLRGAHEVPTSVRSNLVIRLPRRNPTLTATLLRLAPATQPTH